MQSASKDYKQSMKMPLRNRAYIKVTMGTVNQNAQRTINVNDSRNAFAYFADLTRPFTEALPGPLYATAEQNFSRVDGTMMFLPENASKVIFNNGLVTDELLGSIYLVFKIAGLDIKGLTIDFSQCYPADFIIENDNEIKTYTGNDKQNWRTEDVFYGTSWLRITPLKMVNGADRFRILSLICGIATNFTNNEVKSFSFKDYVSPISESIPSQDMTLKVFNKDLTYNVDNPDSAINFMEIGQELSVAFGYDVDGAGNIEWIDSNEVYLKTWKANDSEAEFTATDRFCNIISTYYRGRFRREGITAYELAKDIFRDMGLYEEEYYIDPYLRRLSFNNPMPVVKHTEALQILANACRCVLFQNRQRRIELKSSFIPDMAINTNSQTDFSRIENILIDKHKDAYAMASNDFSQVNGTMLFHPEDLNLYMTNLGYISGEVCDSEGIFELNPVINIMLEAGYVSFGLTLHFRSVAPKEFTISTFYDGAEVEVVVVREPELDCIIEQEFSLFDFMKIEFTRGYPNGRITLDDIIFNDTTDYFLGYNDDLLVTPSGTREEKIKSLSVERLIFSESKESSIKQLVQDEVVASPEKNTHTFYMNNASYNFSASFVVEVTNSDGNKSTEYLSKLDSGETLSLLETSDYYVVLRINGVIQERIYNVVINGFEYAVNKNYHTKQYNALGEEKSWSNPLISTISQARDLEEWVGAYYTEGIEYEISYRGDPRVDANDLFYLELKDRAHPMIRAYENTLSFSGGWSGKMKARRVK